MVPTCNWHSVLHIAVILVLHITNTERIIKITMKCHLKQNEHSFDYHISIFNYGEFSYYDYIPVTFIIQYVPW